MAAADHPFIQKTQKSLFQGSQLLKLSTFAVAGLLSAQASTQAVWAQTEAGAIDLALPQSAPEVPMAQPPVAPVVPAPVVPPPTVITPVTPTPTVPSSIDTTSPKTGPDYGTVFIEPSQQQTQPAPTVESLLGGNQPAIDATPSVNVVSPADYGTDLVDKTDYSVGATMPNVVISERASGCEFSLRAGAQVTSSGCGQTNQLAATGAGTLPTVAGAAASVYSSGIQAATGMTTTASREFYNQAAEAVVKLQLGEKFIFPLTIPASLSSLFGWRMHPIFGAQRFHSGTDVAAPLGTPVVATQAGQVTLSDFAGGYGLMVVLRHHNDTLESRYAHLSRLLVQAGEWVEQGEVIGLVGSTGNSTGPHLHFELRQLTANGWTVLNPDSLLQQTLSTLAQALGNSLVAFADRSNKADTAKVPSAKVTPPLEGIPFRPAQPQAN
ncbi:M23 family metallopeptidase [Leptolyngbya cf. ectocarpi LEGE 11479]|uniref:M23 family metallopeptidase n=1 Tax=Leptolyngbya cf. ectocarpi LEGE 11479 TaxID=1828722 RepID=A0A928X402_LEPEC|nr:M23 family metallopeptidase [Leptolyngbya ectocarpi]MBE9067326.1 M23 family metallopeptidase [Leptolyngbya cf. ectocarpi LEGE 11479]